ncbi:uncharacterized protein B0H64DRAFT_446714 [Chaetomium fimeti]|uniref:Uncharacterized protein n=1 Tax=Chaetomium fimeti TaxID=1854472 RepID=A0AAE0LN95_9PEZI|nr:hypothetical protein B0H64DRAFT_446714 [Chaetomium fimeti]
MSSHSTNVGTASPATVSTRGSKSGNQDEKDEFSWLRKDFNGPEYISYSELSNATYCAFDFGQWGYAASTNDGGELLQMTAPSGKHGIVFAWGDFEFSPDLALARGQREQGGKSSFGLKFLGSEGGESRSYKWSVTERGSFQYRWPIKRFCYSSVDRSRLDANAGTPNEEEEDDEEEAADAKLGTGSLMSFVDKGCLYQVLRLDPTKEFELQLTLECPMQFHSFANPDGEEVEAEQSESRGNKPHKVPKWVTAETKENATTPLVFLAMYRLVEAEHEIQACLKPPWPDEISNVVLAKSSDTFAGTAELWQGLFADRQSKAECVSALCEADIIGRCLEKVLGVDLVPALDKAQAPAAGKDAERQAIVSNMFLRASVDVKGLFWKTRFLVKVDKVLSRALLDEEELYVGTDSTLKAAQETINRVRRAISGILRFVVQELLKSDERLSLATPDDGDFHRHCYPLITVCYIVHAYPDTDWTRDKVTPAEGKLDGSDRNHSILGFRVDGPLPRNGYPVIKVEKALLCHLHGRSIFSLQQKGLLPAVESCDEFELHHLEKAARTALVKRISSARQYEAGDEVSERLVFLAHELWGKEGDNDHNNETVSCLNRILKREERREYTTTINLSDSDPEKGQTWAGPWEVHVLCHHSRLMMAHHRIKHDKSKSREARADGQEHLEYFKRKLCDFLTCEASLTPCWERNNSSAHLRGMLRSEATAVVSSTILDMFLHDYTRALAGSGANRAPDGPMPASCACGLQGTGIKTVSRPFRNRPRHPREGLDAVHLMSLQLDALEAIEAQGEEEQIDYLKFRPPSRFHPDEFFRSLEDTPDYYHEHAISKRSRDLPKAIRQAIRAKGTRPTDTGEKPCFPPKVLCLHGTKSPPEKPDTELSGSSEEEISKPIAGDHLVRLETSETLIAGKLESDEASDTKSATDRTVPHRDVVKEFLDSLGDLSERLRELLTGTEKDGGEGEKIRAIEALLPLAIIDLRMPTWEEKLRTLPLSYGPKILGMITDSLIDQQVRHRILISCVAYQLPKGLLRLLVHILHPEVVECFNNHHLRLSRFQLSSRPEPPVVAHITIRSWSVVWDRELSYATQEEDKIEIPDNLFLEHRRKNNPLQNKPPLVELRVSSVAISTNRFGDFSRCSLITYQIPCCRLKKLGVMAQEIWDKFTHQPQTGRFLVFCMILGELCESLVSDYQDILDGFIRETLPDDKVPIYLEEVDRLQDHNKNADVMLRLSLWGLEALFKVNNTLSASVRVLESAIVDLKREMKNGPGRRSPELESAYHEYLGKLERPFRDLTAIQNKLERKVEFNTRYTNAAVFAVPKDQNVLDEEMGRTWYIKIIIFFAVGILVVGACLGHILYVVDRFVGFVTYLIPEWLRVEWLWGEVEEGVEWLWGEVEWRRGAAIKWLRGEDESLSIRSMCKRVVRGLRRTTPDHGEDEV